MSHDENFETNRGEHEFAELAQALREHRPAPAPEFTERLDAAVADHFPPEWADEAALGKSGTGGIGSFGERVRRRLGGRRVLLPAMAGFAGLLLVATVVVSVVDSNFGGGGGDTGTIQSATPITAKESGADFSTADPVEAMPEAAGQGAGATYGAGSPAPGDSGRTSAAPSSAVAEGPIPMQGKQKRDVAREAEITLGTDPDGVQDVANKVVEVTDDHNGIVMDSKVTDGESGTAGANFQLLIPSGQIESAVAELSGIADLLARSQELTDITAPVNSVEERIADSKARIESLLGELEETYDEGERNSIEQRIRWERREMRWAETRLKRLERRVDYTPVAVRVETGGDSSSDEESSWGLSDAVDDAGKLLGVAAGVTVLALAVAIPIGIVVLIALALNRAWVRRSRRRVLAGDE